MENDALLQLGVGGALTIWVLREVFGFLRTRNGRNGAQKTASKMAMQVDSLYSMHSKTDRDGAPVWYFKPSFELAVRELTKASQEQTRSIDHLRGAIDRQIDRYSRAGE